MRWMTWRAASGAPYPASCACRPPCPPRPLSSYPVQVKGVATLCSVVVRSSKQENSRLQYSKKTRWARAGREEEGEEEEKEEEEEEEGEDEDEAEEEEA